MDIYVFNVKNSANIDENLLKSFQKKDISNLKILNIHCFTYLMLDKILKEVYKIENPKIIFNNGKPILESKEKHFSISHSGKYIAICFSDYNCGIDIEKHKNRDFEKIAEKMNFNVKSLEDFYYEWTKYEAKYKLAEDYFSIKKYKIDEYYLTAVSSNKDEKYNFFINTK